MFSDAELAESLTHYKLATKKSKNDQEIGRLAASLVREAEFIWSLAEKGEMIELEAADRVAMIFEVLEQDTPSGYPNILSAFEKAGSLSPQAYCPKDNTIGLRVWKLLEKINRRFWLDGVISRANRNVHYSSYQLPFCEDPKMQLDPTSTEQDSVVISLEDPLLHPLRPQREPLADAQTAEIVNLTSIGSYPSGRSRRALKL